MSKMFETTEINGMRLANRFVRSATWEGMAAEDGACTPALVDLMAGLAKGKVGLILTSHTYVRQDGQAGPRQLGIYDDSLIQGLREMTRAVHDQGGRIAIQITHAGFHIEEQIVLPLKGFTNDCRLPLNYAAIITKGNESNSTH